MNSLPEENLNLPTKLINQQNLELSIDDFIENDIIYIHSATATGKTRIISKISKELKEKTNCNILSIVNLITLSREQIKTFKENEINLQNYQKGISSFIDGDGVICINSLHKISNLKNFNYANTILYIDEINDLIRCLTCNDALDSVLNLVYNVLIKLIKKCKKIIISDATINQNTINLMSSRKVNNKSLLIKNICQKWKDKKAIKINNESEFIKELKNHIRNKNYFLFGSDVCEMTTELYINLKKEFKEQEKDFILFTGSQKDITLTCATKDFEEKYVFYSPSITTGVSFYLEDVKQDQFIYISRKPQITPIGVFQMSCRTRNINNLIYYANDVKCEEMKYKNLQDVEDKYKKLIQTSEKILSLSKSVNDNDEIQIVNNTFFKLFCYEEYINGIFKTDFIQHYEDILKNSGFEIIEQGEKQNINKEEKHKMKMIKEVYEEEEIEKFTTLQFMELATEEDLKQREEGIANYPLLNSRFKLLGLENKEDIEKYKIFMTDEYALKQYFNFLGLFKTDEYIRKKETENLEQTQMTKLINSNNRKLLSLRKFEKDYHIERFTFDFEKVEIKPTTKETIIFYENTFRLKDINLLTTKGLQDFYIKMIKNICGDLPIITNEKKQIDKVRRRVYTINKDLIINLLTLCYKSNPRLKNFNLELVEKYTGLKPDLKKVKYLTKYQDEDSLITNYMFNKINYGLLVIDSRNKN